MKMVTYAVLAGLLLGGASGAYAQRPVTEVKVSRPTTQVTVFRPTTQTAVSRPVTQAVVQRPETTTAVTRPTTQVQVFRPTTETAVFRPVSAGNSARQTAAVAGSPAGGGGANAVPSSASATSMSGYKPLAAKDFKAPASAATAAAGNALSLGNQVNESEKDAAASAQQTRTAQNPSNLSNKNIMENSKAMKENAFELIQKKAEEQKSAQKK